MSKETAPISCSRLNKFYRSPTDVDIMIFAILYNTVSFPEKGEVTGSFRLVDETDLDLLRRIYQMYEDH